MCPYLINSLNISLIIKFRLKKINTDLSNTRKLKFNRKNKESFSSISFQFYLFFLIFVQKYCIIIFCIHRNQLMEKSSVSAMSQENCQSTLSDFGLQFEEGNDQQIHVDYLEKLRSQRIKIECLLKQYKIKEKETNQMKKELKNQAQIIEQLQECSIYKRKFDDMTLEIGKIKNQYENLRSSYEMLEKENRELIFSTEKKQKQYNSKVQLLKQKWNQQVQILKEKLRCAHDENKSLKLKEATRQTNFKDLQTKNQQMRNQRDKVKIQIKELKNNYSEEVEKCKKQSMQKLEQSIQMRIKTNQIENKLQFTLKNIQDIQEKEKQEKNKLDKAIKDLKRELKMCKNQIKEKQTIEEEKINCIQHLEDQNKEIQKNICEQKKERERLKEQIEQLERKLAREKQAVNQLEKSIRIYIAKWDELRIDLETENEELKKIIKKKQEAEQASKEILKRERKEIDKMNEIVQMIDTC